MFDDWPLVLPGLSMQLMAFLSSESAATGLIVDGELSRHKVLRGYTVRYVSS